MAEIVSDDAKERDPGWRSGQNVTWHMDQPDTSPNDMQDYSTEERRELARKSRAQPPLFGNAERQALTSAAHARMLEREAVSGSLQIPLSYQPVAACSCVSALWSCCPA